MCRDRFRRNQCDLSADAVKVQTLARWLLRIGAPDGHAWGGAVAYGWDVRRGGGMHWCSLSTATTALSSLPLAPPPFPCCWRVEPTLVWQRGSGCVVALMNTIHVRVMRTALPTLPHPSHAHPPRPTQSGQHIILKLRGRGSRWRHPQLPERVERPPRTANEHQCTGVTPRSCITRVRPPPPPRPPPYHAT